MKSRRKTLAKYKAAGRAVQCILIMHITAISNWHPGRQTWPQQNHHERQWKSRKAGKAGWRKCASGRERAWRASERVSEREGATQMPVEANDMQINENKGINEWPKPVEVGTAFAICHFAIAIVRSPQSVVHIPSHFQASQTSRIIFADCTLRPRRRKRPHQPSSSATIPSTRILWWFLL